MIALIKKMVNYVIDYRPGPNRGQMAKNKGKPARFRTVVRPVRFESFRDQDGVMRIREVAA